MAFNLKQRIAEERAKGRDVPAVFEELLGELGAELGYKQPKDEVDPSTENVGDNPDHGAEVQTARADASVYDEGRWPRKDADTFEPAGTSRVPDPAPNQQLAPAQEPADAGPTLEGKALAENPPDDPANPNVGIVPGTLPAPEPTTPAPGDKK